MTAQSNVEQAVLAICTQPALNGVYRLTTPISGLAPVLDGRVLSDKQALLIEIGRSFSFPDYYSANWDALEECLFDLSWHSGSINLLIENTDAIPEAVLATLLDIFSFAAAFWAEAGRGFNLFLTGLERSDIPLAA